MRKKYIRVGVLIAVCIGIILWAAGKPREEKEKNILKIGVSVYKRDDTYISTIVSHLEEYAKRYEKENGIPVRLDVSGANESQSIQNDQIRQYLALNYDVICVNLVDRTEASVMIDQAKDKEIPLIFFNREPVEEDIYRWEGVYYVGFDAKETALLQAQIILDRYHKTPELLDLNGDGIIRYIMFEGEIRHQDSLIRTEKSIQALKDGGMQLEKLSGGIADWNRSQAEVLMEGYWKSFGTGIELVISNNDDMALGAIDALDHLDTGFYNIVGIDATPQGKAAVERGKMLGSVDISAKKCAEILFQMCRSIAMEGSVGEGIQLKDNKYVWVEQDLYISE